MTTTTEARPTKPLRRWMAALAKPRQQEVAREELERRGIKTYFPMTKKDVFNRFTGRFEKFPDYYFGRYFFVEYIPTWIKDVLHAKGVADVLHYDVLVPAPEEVPSTVIDKAAYLKVKGRIEVVEKVPYTASEREIYLKVRSHEVNGFIPIKKKRGLQRGQRVKVISGAMKGHKGTLAEDDDGRSRIAALFDVMGSKDVKFNLEKGSVIAV
jgi:transcription antitermination factor NusG